MDIDLLLRFIGAAVGVVVFVWALSHAFSEYLHIKILSPEKEKNYLMVRTEIENKSKFNKHLDFAFLLISPMDEKPVETIKKISSDTKENLDVLKII